MISTKRLVKMAKKWQKLAAASRKRISYNRKAHQQIEKGHFVVYTSDEKRFSLPLAYLQSEIFIQLLRVAEEFGLVGDGPIMLPCDSNLLDYAISITQKCASKELVVALMASLSPCHSSLSAIHPQQVLINCC